MTCASRQGWRSGAPSRTHANTSGVVVVRAELRAGAKITSRPRVLHRGVERGPGEVEPGRAPVDVERLGLQPGQDAQRLGVALEPPAGRRELVERVLAVVAERRVAEVVGEARGVDQVRVAADRLPELAADLGDLERVGQAVADEVVGARPVHLGLGGEPAQRGAVHDPRAVPLERRTGPPLGRLRGPPLAVGVVVRVRCRQRH